MKAGNADADTSVDEYYPFCKKVETGIANMVDNKTAVVVTEYYSLSGQRVSPATKGITIIKQLLANGKTAIKKRIL